MSDKVKVSVIVPVKNEKNNIVKCLNSLDWADEVFVVDSQSTDGTIELAEGAGAKVVQFHFNGTYPKKKNWALDNLPIRNKWVLLADADEVFPKALQEEIRDAVEHPSDGINAYRMHFQYMFMGKPIRHCGYTGLWIPRLIKRGSAHFEKMPTGEGTAQNIGDMEIHEHLIVNGNVGSFKTSVEHYAYPTIHSFVEKHNRYSNWEADLYDDFVSGKFANGAASASKGVAIKRKIKGLYLRLPCRPFLRFCYHYFARAGFLDGRMGFIFCVLLGFYDFLSKAKVYEKKHCVCDVRKG